MSTPTLSPGATAAAGSPGNVTKGKGRPIRPGEPAETLYLFSSACTIVVLVCAWMLLQMLVLGRLSETRAQHLLYLEYRSQLATETAPTGALDFDGKPVAEGSPVALMSIPAIGLHDVIVADGTASGDLLDGPGHLRTTPLPGNVGTSLVMGRSTTYGAPFGKITSLRPGDEINVLGAQGSTHLPRQGRTSPRRPDPAVAYRRQERPAHPGHGGPQRLPLRVASARCGVRRRRHPEGLPVRAGLSGGSCC